MYPNFVNIPLAIKDATLTEDICGFHPSGILVVKILAAERLLAGDFRGTFDPYAKIKLGSICHDLYVYSFTNVTLKFGEFTDTHIQVGKEK